METEPTTESVEPDYSALKAILNANRAIQDKAPDMSFSETQTFLGVAIWGGDGSERVVLSMRELASHVDLPYTTVSRHLRDLGDGLSGQSGLGLTETRVWPDDTRRKYSRLSAKGEVLASEIADAFRSGL